MRASGVSGPMQQVSPPLPWGAVALVLGLMLAAMALMLAGQPLLPLGLLLSVPVALLVLQQPDRVVPLVMFAMFTNTPAILSKVHGLPFVVGAAIPMMLCLPIARDVLFRGQKLVITPLVPLLVLYIVVEFLSALASLKPEVAVLNVVESLAEGLLLYGLVTNAIRSRKVVRQTIWALILAGAFLGGLALTQQLTQTYDSNYWGFSQPSRASFETGEESVTGTVEQLRLGGPLGQQNRFAQLMGMLLMLALFQAGGGQSRGRRLAALLAFVLIGLGMALAFSRGAVVGLGLTLALMVATRTIRVRGIAIVGAALLVVALAVPQYGARLSSLTELGISVGGGGPGVRNADSAVRSRLTEMAAAAFMFVDRPLLGVGPGMYREHYREYAEILGLKVKGVPRQSHNLYLGLAAEIGLLGLGVFGAILLVAYRDLLRARRRWRGRDPEMANIATALAFAMFSYLATGLFLHFAYVRFFWTMLALASAVSRLTPADGPRPGVHSLSRVLVGRQRLASRAGGSFSAARRKPAAAPKPDWRAWLRGRASSR